MTTRGVGGAHLRLLCARSAILPAKSRVRRGRNGWRKVPIGATEGPQAVRGGIVSPRWLWMPDEGENEGNGEGGESPLEEVSPAAPQRNGVITWARGNSERPLSTLFSFSVKENKVEKCSRNGFWGGLSSPVPPRSLARPDNTSQEVSGGCRTCHTLAMDNIKHARRENHAIVDRKTVSHDVRLGTGGALTRRPNTTNGTWLMGGTAGVQEQQGAGGALIL